MNTSAHAFFAGVIYLSVVMALVSCGGGSHTENATHESVSQEKDWKTVNAKFEKLNTQASGFMHRLTQDYLGIKNGLFKDNGQEAARFADSMFMVLATVDKSMFTAEEKKIYDENEADLKENAEHIGKNGKNIKHQREHFMDMSEEMYSLVKAFGGGMPLYKQYCPMANNGNGAMWIGESDQIKNPYYGAEMPECGDVKEEVK